MDNIEVLNEIMKPYFDKKDEISNAPKVLSENVLESKERKSNLRNERINKRKELEVELENLRARKEADLKEFEAKKQVELENLRVRKQIAIKDFEEKKGQEIEAYISKVLDSNSSFYSSYGAMLRKDLERNYDKKLKEIEAEFDEKEKALISEIEAARQSSVDELEEKLISEIEVLKKVSEVELELKENLDKLNNQPDYTRVYLREMVELKDDLRKNLFREIKRLNNRLEELEPEKQQYELAIKELNEQQLKFSEINNAIVNFKYEYNSQNQVINIDDWRKLHEERIEVSAKINELTEFLSERMNLIQELNNINKALLTADEYLKLTDLTKDETNAVMMTMTPWERAEYDRRKGLNSDKPNKSENLVAVVSKSKLEDDKIVVDTKIDLLKAIFTDVISVAKEIRGVKLTEGGDELGAEEYHISVKESKNSDYEEVGNVNLVDKKPMQLPTGEYLYEEDFNEAVENYYNQEKDRTYVVKSTGKEYTISAETISKFKSKLKKCSAIKLLKNNAISKFDITNVFGKVKAEKLFRVADIGTIFKKINMPDGDYINRNELIARLNNLFDSKKLDWLRKISGKLKGTESEDLEEDPKNLYILNEDEKSFIIKK